MTAALEVEQIGADPSHGALFRLFVLDFDSELVVHDADLGEKPGGYTEDQLSRSLIAERGLPEHDAHLLIAGAKARFEDRKSMTNI